MSPNLINLREGGKAGDGTGSPKGREGGRTRGPNGSRYGMGSLITLGSLIKFWGPEGPPPSETTKSLKNDGVSIGI